MLIWIEIILETVIDDDIDSADLIEILFVDVSEFILRAVDIIFILFDKHMSC